MPAKVILSQTEYDKDAISANGLNIKSLPMMPIVSRNTSSLGGINFDYMKAPKHPLELGLKEV